MLLSLTRKFLFIANLKSASTSIERVLAPYSELRLMESRFGKHMSFAEFADRFKWLLSIVDARDLFIFGVMRAPVDYVISLYNSHREERFRDAPKLYTGNMDFAQFIAEWAPRNADQLRPQFRRFTGAEGQVAANVVISFDKLREGMEIVAERLQVKELRNLPKVGPSPPGITLAELTPDQVQWVETRFEQDCEFMARYCDRLLG